MPCQSSRVAGSSAGLNWTAAARRRGGTAAITWLKLMRRRCRSPIAMDISIPVSVNLNPVTAQPVRTDPAGSPAARARIRAALPPSRRIDAGCCAIPGNRTGCSRAERSRSESPRLCCTKARRPSSTASVPMADCISGQNHEGPRSKPSSAGLPASSTVRMRPPRRSRASNS